GAPALKWKKITENVLNKAEANRTLASYYKDHKDEYMCLNCYNAIVVNGASTYVEHAAEWVIGLKRRRNDNISMVESISLLTNIIFEREVIGNEPPIVTFSQLKVIAVDKNNQLGFFFNEIEAMVCLERKNEAERRALKRDNNLSWVDSINVLTKLLYDREKNEKEPIIYSFKQLRREMVAKDFRLSGFFDSIYNALLPENRSDKYLNKLDKKLAVECYIICGNQNSNLIAFKKDISLFVDLMRVFAEAIDALSYTGKTISRRHLNREKTAIADDYPYRFYYEVSLDKKLENMTLHKYDSRIQERWEERLKEIDSYIYALQQVHKTPLLTNYLTNNIIPLVADWPGQVFTWQAITLRLQNCENIPDCILSFIPIIVVLHIQLNLLESILKIYWDFFDMEYQYVFSTSKALSITPSLYRIF
ncbi:12677_t:CDS:2, partial [Gigaspora rosea]